MVRWTRALTILALVSVTLSAGTSAAAPAPSGSWTALGPAGESISSLTIAPDNPTVVYAGTASGRIFRSLDRGDSWAEISTGLPGSNVSAIQIDPRNPNFLYAGTMGGGVYRSTDGGASWAARNTGLLRLVVHDLALDPRNPDVLYAGIYSECGQIWKTTDGGASWAHSSSGLPACDIYRMLIDPTNPNVVYAGGASVYKSIDGGATWTDPSSLGLGSIGAVRGLAIDPSNPEILFAGTESGPVFKSTDGAVTWVRLNTGPAGAIGITVAVDPMAPSTVYAGASGSGMYRSTDGGSTWSAIGSGLPAGATGVLAMQANAPQTVYLGTSGSGVYRLAPVNRPPTANAGGPYSTPTGGSVTLIGAGTDPDGDPLTYAWDLDGNGSFEVAGRSVPFSAASLTAPSSRVVTLRVCDDKNACATAAAPVTIMVGVPGTTVTWSQWSTTTAPSPRSGQGLAYDAGRDKVVLFGGASQGCAPQLNDTWEYDRAGWRQVSASGPSARDDVPMTYDSTRGRIVLFGGRSGSYEADTWEFDGTTWMRRLTAHAPPGRSNAALTFDSRRGRTVLFGGWTNTQQGNDILGDTWEYDGTDWQQIISAVGPTQRAGTRMVFVPSWGKSVLFGGYSPPDGPVNDTWLFDGSTWSQAPTTARPPGRYDHQMAYDPVRNVVVLFGGYYNGPLPLPPGTPAFPGTVALYDTWEFDGANWYEVMPTTRPPATWDGAATYDASHNAVLLFGGNSPGQCDTASTTWLYGPRTNGIPTAEAGGPYGVPEGGSITLAGSGSDPDAGDTLTFIWDLDGNGSFETAGQSVNFSAAGLVGGSSRTVHLRVCDPLGECASDSAMVNILSLITIITPSPLPSRPSR